MGIVLADAQIICPDQVIILIVNISVYPISVCGELFIVQLHTMPQSVGAMEFNVAPAICQIGVNEDGILQTVAEPIIHAAPIDRCIHSIGHIGHQKHMRLPLNDLQFRFQTAVIEGGRHLTDAAAHLLLGISGNIDGGFPIALVRSSLPNHLVEGEHITGL